MEEPEKKGVGYLGVDWELANGVYRIKKIIRGAEWDTEGRSPLDDWCKCKRRRLYTCC